MTQTRERREALALYAEADLSTCKKAKALTTANKGKTFSHGESLYLVLTLEEAVDRHDSILENLENAIRRYRGVLNSKSAADIESEIFFQSFALESHCEELNYEYVCCGGNKFFVYCIGDREDRTSKVSGENSFGTTGSLDAFCEDWGLND